MLRFCKNCGLLLPHDADHCPQCGTPAPAAVRAAAPQPGQAAPLYEADEPEERIPAMSQADTTITMLLFAIPLVGLILALVWSFSDAPDNARKRLARAYLTRTLIVAAVIAALLLLGAVGLAAVTHSMYYYLR